MTFKITVNYWNFSASERRNFGVLVTPKKTFLGMAKFGVLFSLPFRKIFLQLLVCR